jgi:hypothetical protein
MLLSIALGVLVGAVVPGVDSIGRSVGSANETQTTAGAIGVLAGPPAPSSSPTPEPTEAPTRSRTSERSGSSTQQTESPSGGTVVIIATPQPTDDSSVHEGDSHSSGSSSSSSDDSNDHDTPEPEPTATHDEHCCN